MFYVVRKIIATVVAFLITLCGNLDFAGVFAAPDNIMAEYYVSTCGNDNNTGSRDAPFLTLERARDEVRKINKNMTGNIVVYLDNGTYVLDETLFPVHRCPTAG